MNIREGFSYIFRDKEWSVKLFIGSVLLFLSFMAIPAPFLIGYLAFTAKRVMNKNRLFLPRWENWGEMYKLGLKVGAILLVFWFLSSLSVRIVNEIPGVRAVSFLIPVIINFLLPIGVLRYLTTGKFEEAFALDRIFFFVKEHFGDLFILWLLGIGLAFISLSGFFIFIIGIFFTSFYALLVSAYLYADFFRENSTGSPVSYKKTNIRLAAATQKKATTKPVPAPIKKTIIRPAIASLRKANIKPATTVKKTVRKKIVLQKKKSGKRSS